MVAFEGGPLKSGRMRWYPNQSQQLSREEKDTWHAFLDTVTLNAAACHCADGCPITSAGALTQLTSGGVNRVERIMRTKTHLVASTAKELLSRYTSVAGYVP